MFLLSWRGLKITHSPTSPTPEYSRVGIYNIISQAKIIIIDPCEGGGVDYIPSILNLNEYEWMNVYWEGQVSRVSYHKNTIDFKIRRILNFKIAYLNNTKITL